MYRINNPRQRRRTAKSGVALILAGALALAGCTSSGAGADATPVEPVSGGTITLGVQSEGANVDPARCGTNDWMLCSSLFGALMIFNHDTEEFEPQMAESLESEDGQAWTLTLREGITFTDGEPFDADAVIYNWERVKEMGALAPGLAFVNAMEYKKIDEHVISIALAAPNYQLPWAFQSELAFVGSPKALQEKGEDFVLEPVGAGPFSIGSWTQGSEIRLVRNASYWDAPRPYVDELVMRVISTDEQRTAAVQSGEIDVAFTTVTEAQQAYADAGLNVDVLPFIAGLGVRFSFTKGPLADERIRQAIMHAVDRTAMRDAVTPLDDVADTFSKPDSLFFEEKAVLADVDVEKASKLVSEYLADTGESEVRIELKAVAGTPAAQLQAELLQAQLKSVGINLVITNQEIAAWFADTQAGNYEMQVMGVSGTNPEQLRSYWYTGEARNTTGYSNAEVDRFLDEARTAGSAEARNQAYKEATVVLAETGALVPWSYQKSVIGSAAHVGGIVPAFTFHILTDRVFVANQ